MCSQSSTNPTRNRKHAAPTTTQRCGLCGTKNRYVPATASQMATPPIIAVEFLCQRSVFGLATNPQRRANIRTNGVNKSASANETAGGIRLDKLRGNIVCKLRGKAIRLKRQRQVGKN